MVVFLSTLKKIKIQVLFMNWSERTGLFSWPSSDTGDDKCWALYRDICLISGPELQGPSARCYALAAQDEVHIKEKLPAFT